MTYIPERLRRFAGELQREPAARIPAKLASAARGKLRLGIEQAIYRTGAGRIVARRYSGPGLVLMFHEIHPDVDGELRTGCSPAQLGQWVEIVRAAGRDIVSPEEALRRLADPSARPFAVLTFDDGYRDTLTVALPMLERLDAPMTVFVPTGMITRDIYAWWLGLRELFKRHEEVDVEAMGHAFHCPDVRSKAAAIREVTAWIGTDPNRAAALGETLKRRRVELPDLVAQYAMDEDELTRLGRHPLVTIGGHTASHPWLARLEEASARQEVAANKAYLETVLDRHVRHLAYPYGTAGACGLREAQLAWTVGFDCAFTTRSGHLFPDHLHHPHMMPRENAGLAHQSRAAIMNRLHGANRAIETGFGAVVAITA